MKKIFTLLFVGIACSVFSQSNITPFPEDFGTNNTYPASFESANSTESTYSTDWIIDDASTAPGIPVCNVGGSSGGSKLFGANSLPSLVQEVRTMPVSTNTFVNIQVGWNALKLSGSSPAVTVEWSRDNGSSWTNIAYTNTSGNNTWGVVTPVSLPATANGTIIIVRWYYTATGSGDYVAIDDVKITGTPSPSFYWNGSGALDNVASWGTNTNGTGSNPPSFSAANQNFFIRNAATAALTNNWVVSGSGSVLNIGDGTVGNACNLTIPATFALTMSGATLNVTNSSTLTIVNTTFPSIGDVSLGATSTVDFAQNSTVTLWATTTFGNLVLSGSGSKQQPNGNVSINGNFTIGAGISYIMSSSNTRTTRLSGAISCNATGSITTNNSRLTIDGSGTIGTVNFTGSTGMNNFTLDRTGETLTLGSTSSPVVNGITTITGGNITLNGRSLTLNGAISFPASATNGSITGSATSSLIIGGSGAITNNLIMSQASAAARTLDNFSMGRSGSTIGLANDLLVNTLSFTAGNIDLNGRSLTLDGPITFPTTATNGVFVGSTSSSISITGVIGGSITNPLFMSQSSNASKSLGLFSNTRTSSSMTLGNDMIISGTANLLHGVYDITGISLTMSGPITFPTNATRNFLGSLTSSITIDGSGSITNSMFMNQTNSTTRSLGMFTMNRSGQTLTLGNVLETYGTVLPTLGTIAMGSNNLFIRSNATAKGRIGPVGGSLTGTARVETFAPGGTTDWALLSTSGISSQTFANWDNQIFMSCSGCTNGPNTVGSASFVSIQGWAETAATSNPAAQYPDMTASSAITPGVGYWVYLGTAFGTTSDITWTVSGAPVTGAQPVTLTFSGPTNGNGSNLIANPYPSPISWAGVLASNPSYTGFMDDTYYVYSANQGVMASYNGGLSSPAAAGLTDNIPMGQGFYVTTFASPGAFSIQESNKVSNNNSLVRTANNIGTVVRLSVYGGGSTDETAIRFHGDAATAFDRLDARKMYDSPGYLAGSGKRTTIATVVDGQDYSINSLPNANTADAVIPVMVKVKASGQHSITATDLQNLPNSCTILKDKLLNVEHDLKTGPYVCTIADTTSAPRFELRVCADAAMSVKETKNSASQFVSISNDANGVYVKFDYDKSVKSTISVTNILGQKIVDTKTVNLSKEKVYLDVPEKNQVIFVTVRSESGQVTKKMIR
jgi:hypothetical protein